LFSLSAFQGKSKLLKLQEPIINNDENPEYFLTIVALILSGLWSMPETG